VFQPLVNAAFAEVLHCAQRRMQGHRIDLSQLESLLASAWERVRAGAPASVLDVSADAGRFLLDFASCYAACLAGDTARADFHYLASLQRALKLPESSWMRALLWWARLERSMLARDAQEIATCARALVSVAHAGEHKPMARLAARLDAEARRHLSTLASQHATWF
jgi:hypothetical protein